VGSRKVVGTLAGDTQAGGTPGEGDHSLEAVRHQ